MTEEAKNFGLRLRWLREDAGLTQTGRKSRETAETTTKNPRRRRRDRVEGEEVTWFWLDILLFTVVIFFFLIGTILGFLRTVVDKPKGAALLFLAVLILILIGLLFPLFDLHFGGE